MDKDVLRNAAKLHPGKILFPYDTIMDNEGGFEAICTLVEHFGGLSVYVPNLRTIFAKCLEAEARNEFKGSNYKSLSRKFGFTERHLRRLLN